MIAHAGGASCAVLHGYVGTISRRVVSVIIGSIYALKVWIASWLFTN